MEIEIGKSKNCVTDELPVSCGVVLTFSATLSVQLAEHNLELTELGLKQTLYTP